MSFRIIFCFKCSYVSWLKWSKPSYPEIEVLQVPLIVQAMYFHFCSSGICIIVSFMNKVRYFQTLKCVKQTIIFPGASETENARLWKLFSSVFSQKTKNWLQTTEAGQLIVGASNPTLEVLLLQPYLLLLVNHILIWTAWYIIYIVLKRGRPKLAKKLNK